MSGTQSVNLLPPAFLAAKLRRRRLRTLAACSAAYLAALAAACALVKVATAPAGESAVVELSRLEEHQRQTAATQERVDVQLCSLRARLDARKSLALQPDFSLLLAALGTCVDEEIAVRQFQLASTGIDPTRPPLDLPRGLPQANPAGRPAGSEREPRHFTLSLRGSATSEVAISRLVSRLHELRLFDSVDLKRTGRVAGMARGSGEGEISFEIACLLVEPADRPAAPVVGAAANPSDPGGPR